MARLAYSVIQSVDGYVADQRGDFDWAAPDEEVHAFINDLERSIATYLYGRRLYETMVFWETAQTLGDLPAVEREYARIWQAADKIVYSSTLESVSSARTRIERAFDPGAVAAMKTSGGVDMSVGGPHLAAQALRAGLVDELQLFLAPVVVGGGNASLPRDLRLDLDLNDERRFSSGFVFLRYLVRPTKPPG